MIHIVAIVYATIFIGCIIFMLFEIFSKNILTSSNESPILLNDKSWIIKISNFLIIISTLPAVVFVVTFLLVKFRILNRPNYFILKQFYSYSCLAIAIGLVNLMFLGLGAFRSVKYKKQIFLLLKHQVLAIVSLVVSIFMFLVLRGR
jgi:hypothetical protein